MPSAAALVAAGRAPPLVSPPPPPPPPRVPPLLRHGGRAPMHVQPQGHGLPDRRGPAPPLPGRGLSHLIALRPREKNRGGHQVPRPRPDLIPRAWCGGCRARRPPARATGETQRKGSKSLIALGTTPARRDHIYHELDLVVTTG